MLKKTISYFDLDGNPVTEDFYFNLSKAEITEMELSKKGGMKAHIERIIASTNQEEILKEFKSIITMSVGRRSEDGRRFVKSQEITDDFVQTDAYSELFVELVTNETSAANFIKGLLPAGLAEKIAKDQASATDDAVVRKPDAKILPVVEEEKLDPTPWITEDREPTSLELRLMTKDELMEVMKRKMGNANND